MSDQNEAPAQNVLQREMAAEIVSAYVSKNSVPPAELPGLIQSIYTTLGELGKPPVEAPAPTKREPAVPIRKSVTDEYIISLEDGRKFKSLKRYLATSHNMTPAEYRAKWGLPSDYPMVAPGYAARRSELAKTIGLGRKAVQSAPAPEAAPASQPEPEAAAATPKRGRKKAA